MSASTKTKDDLANAYISCLLSEIIAYQNQVKAFKTVTQTFVPDRDLREAVGMTNTAKDAYYARLAEEREKPVTVTSAGGAAKPGK